MRRHGWTLCLGLLVGGPAAAQPPAAGESSPPAPDLPGVVVAQEKGVLPLVQPEPKKDAVEPGTLPIPDSSKPDPGAPAAPVPVDMPGPTAPSLVAPPCAAPAAGPGCPKAGSGSVLDWCTFRSHATQSGHFVTPYRPPLIAWFPCERRCGPCGAWPTPVLLPAPVPAVVVPGPTVAPVVPAPAGPAPTPPQVGCPGPAPETDVLSGFMKTPDGLNFAPGVAPLANPTTQVHRVSHWRPK
jgi:hypothetical protein